jgi:GT2 family glycosyltransferase
VPKYQDSGRLRGKERRISIVVAVLNGANTIQRCIDSVATQTYPNRELIIMDGSSTDGTAEILKSNDSRIMYWESKPDRGLYHAWNKALDRVTGEWVCFLGADDQFAAANSLSMLVYKQDPHINFVSGQAMLVDEKGRVLKVEGAPWSWENMKRYQVIAHPASLHRYSLFEEYGKFDEAYKVAGDYEFLLRVGANMRAAYVDKVVVLCEVGGLSRSQLKGVFKETRKIQSIHPEIGFSSTLAYYTVISKAVLRRLIRGF